MIEDIRQKIAQGQFEFSQHAVDQSIIHQISVQKLREAMANSVIANTSGYSMKTTRYFEEQVLRKRPYLQREWCQQALDEPIYYEIQSEDDRIRYWVFIPELGSYLRVITLPDGETIHNAFPDRTFKPEG